MRFQVFIAAALLFGSLSYAADKTPESTILRDAKNYVDTIEKVSKLKIDDQIDVWQTFLSDNPKQTFKKEIEKNIEILQSLAQKKSAGKQGDEKDADLYLKALEFSKKLSLQDQISLWEQFLEENPTSIYRNEALTRLSKLKRYKSKTQNKPAPAPLQQQAPTSQIQPVPNSTMTVGGGTGPGKDRDKALMLAGLAGLVVPGMGHWYTEDYVIAGVLTVIRVGGFAIGIPGMINSEYNKIYVGGGMALLSYAVDIADAPYSADRFNDKLQHAFLTPEEKTGRTIPLFAYSVRF